MCHKTTQKITQMQISDKAIEAVKNNNKAVASLMAAFDRGERSIQMWLANKNIILTTPAAVEAIKKATGMKESEILVKA